MPDLRTDWRAPPWVLPFQNNREIPLRLWCHATMPDKARDLAGRELEQERV